MKNEFNESIHPGVLIKENYLDKGGLTQKELSRILGVSRQTVNSLIQGKIKITPAMGLRLSNKLGQSVDYWLKLQKNYNKNNNDNDFITDLLKNWRTLGSRILVDHEIKTAIDNDIMRINGYSEEFLQSSTYDLRIGSQALISSSDESSPIDLKEEPLLLKPNATTIVNTFESIELPKFILGRVGAMTKLCQHGIITMHGIQVDPGFRGNLFVTLHNIGNNTYEIACEESFLSIEFYFLSIQPDKEYEGSNKNRDNFLDIETETVGKKANLLSLLQSKYSEEDIQKLMSLLELIRQ